MFEPADQVLDLARSNICGGEVEGSLAAERSVRRGKPGSHLVDVALEQLQPQADDTRKPNQPIGLFRFKSLGVLASGQRARWNLEQLSRASRRETKYSPEPFERIVGEALLEPRMEFRGLEGLKAEQ
jgi:hypothetical protein